MNISLWIIYHLIKKNISNEEIPKRRSFPNSPITKSKYFSSPIAKSFAKSKILSPPPRRQNYVSAFQSGQIDRIVNHAEHDAKRIKKTPTKNGPMDGFRKQQQLWQQYSGRSRQPAKSNSKKPNNSSITSFFRPVTEK